MIERLSVRNFKSWTRVNNLHFGKITALFGANSSGKTSLIQFLLALKQTAASQDRRVFNLGGSERDYVDLGSYVDVVHAHETTNDVGFDISLRNLRDTRPQTSARINIDSLDIRVEFRYLDNEIVLQFLQYETLHRDESFRVSVKRRSDGEYEVDSDVLELRRLPQIAFSGLGFYVLPRIATRSASGTRTNSDLQKEMLPRELPRIFEDFLKSIFYLGPLRDYPHRDYRWTGERPNSVGTRGEFAVQAMLAGIVSRDRTQDPNLVESANHWMQRLGLVDRIDLRPISEKSRLYELVVQSASYGHEANIMDVGFGVSQVLPIIVLSHFAPVGSLIILEQPEIHLHPRVQAELADLFLETAVKRNVQFFIESHSEHLLNRLQHRMTERSDKLAALQDGDVRLYFCRREPETSVLEPVQIGEAGKIANVPTDFYDPISDFIGTLQVNADGQPSDLSERHDEYIAQNLTRELRDKDDQSE